MTPEQVAATVANGGAPSGTTIVEWVAKSRQESSHRETVVNTGGNPPKRHVGLFQIQETHAKTMAETSAMSPDQFVKWLKNPGNNFKAAKTLYSADGWGPWKASGGKPDVTAGDEAAVKALGAELGKGPLDSVGDVIDDVTGAVTGPIDSVTDALRSIVELFTSGYEWITNRKNVGRLAIGTLGGIVAIGALLALTKPAISSVTEVIPK